MALAHDIRAVESGIVNRIADIANEVKNRWAQYRVYRTTVNELSALSTRELADLGINPSMIRRIALEAAYGKNADLGK